MATRRPPRDALALLANPINRRILSSLRVEAAHPRRLSKALDVGETEVSRRLRALERAGLVAGSWSSLAPGGKDAKNVRLYRLVASRVAVSVEPAGVAVTLEREGGGATPVLRPTEDFRFPRNPLFVGDARSLARALDRTPVLYFEGMAGTGKTTLAAEVAGLSGRRVLWHTARSTDSSLTFLHRLAAFLVASGVEDLARALDSAAPPDAVADAARAAADRPDVLVAIDDAHEVQDSEFQALLKRFIADIEHARLLVLSRELPRFLPPGRRVRVVEVKGFSESQSLAFLRAKQLRLPRKLARALHVKFTGHPLLLNFYAEALLAGRLNLDEALDDVPEAEVQSYLWESVYESLPERERRVLEAASVFRGAFAEEAVRAASGDSRTRYALFHLERRLLLTRVGGRFVIHDVVRRFAYDVASERPALHRRAAQYYLGLGTLEGRLEALHHRLAGGDRKGAVQLLERDVAPEELDVVAEGYTGLYESVLLELSREDLPPRARFTVVDDLGDVAYVRGELGVALDRYSRSHAAALAFGDEKLAAHVVEKAARAVARGGRIPAEARARAAAFSAAVEREASRLGPAGR